VYDGIPYQVKQRADDLDVDRTPDGRVKQNDTHDRGEERGKWRK